MLVQSMLHMSSFLAVFLTVLVTRPQQRPDTQAGLPQPWVGVARGSQTQQTMSEGRDLQETGRHPELRTAVIMCVLLLFLSWRIIGREKLLIAL